MRLEQCVASEKFDKNAANTPDITRKTPPEVQNDFGRTIVTGRHHTAVVFIIECRRSKIDKPNFGLDQHFALTRPPVRSCCRAGNSTLVGESLIIFVHKEDILGLQISVNEVQVVQIYGS